MKRIFYFILSSLFLIPPGYSMDTHSASPLERELIQAAKSGDLACVQALIAHAEVHINATDENTATALHGAARNGHKEVVKLLLEKGADIDTEDENNHTPLHSAAYAGYAEVVKLLLQKGASINTRVEGNEDEDEEEEGYTALHLAAENGHKEVVELLLKSGADINAKDEEDNTALHVAAQCGHKEVVELLLKSGADINAKDEEDNTALHVAAQCGHKEVVELLLKSGADINAKDEEDYTALHVAAENDYKGIAEMLISFNAQVPQDLILHQLVMQAQKDQAELRSALTFKARARLLNQGIYACPAIKELVALKRELLLEAVKCNSVEKVETLLKEGFSINTCGRDGDNLLHVVIAHKSNKVLRFLLYFCSQDNKNVWDKKNSRGLTPIQVALATSNFEALKIILGISQENITTDATQATGSKRHRREDTDLKSK
ncbi:ankyrin repeat domain-containing protein [Candidatus Dependentiae bacterium]|nr:ankyrin repeat domain-containing protein [Candidatus Dependentiae bacterium]